jgi:hypothetical protein
MVTTLRNCMSHMNDTLHVVTGTVVPLHDCTIARTVNSRCTVLASKTQAEQDMRMADWKRRKAERHVATSGETERKSRIKSCSGWPQGRRVPRAQPSHSQSLARPCRSGQVEPLDGSIGIADHNSSAVIPVASTGRTPCNLAHVEEGKRNCREARATHPKPNQSKIFLSCASMVEFSG